MKSFNSLNQALVLVADGPKERAATVAVVAIATVAALVAFIVLVVVASAIGPALRWLGGKFPGITIFLPIIIGLGAVVLGYVFASWYIAGPGIAVFAVFFAALMHPDDPR